MLGRITADVRGKRTNVMVLRCVAIIAAVVLWLPAGAVSIRFFPLVRRSVQLGMLPQYPAATLMLDSCATLRLNRMPEFCERVYKLRAPDPALATVYPEQVMRSGWQLVERRSAKSYDWYARRIIEMDCLAFRTWLWGINEMLIVAIFDQRVIFLAGSDNIGYCERYMRM